MQQEPDPERGLTAHQRELFQTLVDRCMDFGMPTDETFQALRACVLSIRTDIQGMTRYQVTKSDR
ncbi:hypothetical protein [Frankia sp. AvcI1]|uniref:hypothetical protein n=1 Tax=Frankia sp. AvcI1 TaxID=573496 RepID=UPI000A681EF9|nr:hypothetical protein [Frankia sp. AvcI1]